MQGAGATVLCKQGSLNCRSRPLQAHRSRAFATRQTRQACSRFDGATHRYACGRTLKQAALGESEAPLAADTDSSGTSFQGEDAAKFEVEQQSTAKWAFFTVELAVVLGILYLVWVAPGSGLAEPFTRNIESLAHNSHLSMLAIFGVFALVHSGMAFLRPSGAH
ncbi:hypothetical protein WJX73_010380 [Symbiochloris irregularis]|uniref:Uncharacterized protein n=1 Tax=Symbiochloris irregularis TaxID=706552 RepID=A0AAW1PE44_9CHLO